MSTESSCCQALHGVPKLPTLLRHWSSAYGVNGVDGVDAGSAVVVSIHYRANLLPRVSGAKSANTGIHY